MIDHARHVCRLILVLGAVALFVVLAVATRHLPSVEPALPSCPTNHPAPTTVRCGP